MIVYLSCLFGHINDSSLLIVSLTGRERHGGLVGVAVASGR